MASKVKLILAAGAVAVLLSSSIYLLSKEGEGKLFPFYLPWDDDEETVVSISGKLDKPAGNLGYVRAGEDGHLYVGGKRIRLLGVNICGGAAFPTKDEAGKIAARLAKFGINVVRFHHMDASWETFNIFNKTFGDTRHLNPEALDRLDYFITKLKENGIYVDLNLLVSRRFTSADGLPAEISEMDWKDQQVLGFFVEKVDELEKEYAEQLLTHRNSYTGLTYAEDPAVAFVEIVNEQGLIQGWLGGVVDGLPAAFKEGLGTKWNEYLSLKYDSDEKLAEAWNGEGDRSSQDELLANGNFEAGLEGWAVEVHDGAEASYEVVEGSEGLRALEVDVTNLGSAAWHVQFNYPGLDVKAGEKYLVKFRARADGEVRVSVSLKQAHEPWNDLSIGVGIGLTTEWREFEVALTASAPELNARLDISGLGAVRTTYQFSRFSMKPFKGHGLIEGESLRDSTVQTLTLGEYGKRTVAAERAWVEFLYGLEEGYFTGMHRYLDSELGVKALTIGTIVGCSTPNIMSQLDVMDTHAYWNHPAFPGSPWDSSDWYVVNEPMVNHLDDGTLSSLALKKVYNKPHIVSEYNHPAPNMYDAETAMTLATYAALQDWDGIFLFDYGSRDDWDSTRIRGYFDVDQHPIKMASFLPAYMVFVRGDIEPASYMLTSKLDRQREIDLIASGRATAWDLPDGGHLGMGADTHLIHRTALTVDGEPESNLGSLDVSVSESVYVSDNGEVTWNITDRERGLFLVNTSRSIAVVGFGGGKSFDFGDVVVEPGDTLLDGWSVVTLSVLEGESFRDWDKLLLLAVGYAANTGMRIREYEGGREIAVGSTDLMEMSRYNGLITCGTSWGEAPTLVEGVSSGVKIKTSEDFEVWALDNIGERVVRVPVSTEGERKVFYIGSEFSTVWYELVVEG